MISVLSLSKFIRLQQDYRKKKPLMGKSKNERESKITGNAQNNQNTKGDERVQMKECQSNESKQVKSEQQVWICLGDRSFIQRNWWAELCCSLRMCDGTWDWLIQTLVEVTPLVMWNVLLSSNWQPNERLLSLWLGDQWWVEQQAKGQKSQHQLHFTDENNLAGLLKHWN